MYLQVTGYSLEDFSILFHLKYVSKKNQHELFGYFRDSGYYRLLTKTGEWGRPNGKLHYKPAT